MKQAALLIHRMDLLHSAEETLLLDAYAKAIQKQNIDVVTVPELLSLKDAAHSTQVLLEVLAQLKHVQLLVIIDSDVFDPQLHALKCAALACDITIVPAVRFSAKMPYTDEA